MPDEREIFTIRAMHCRRCGGLLTSKDALKDGLGYTCKMKLRKENEQNKPLDGQINFFNNQSEEAKP